MSIKYRVLAIALLSSIGLTFVLTIGWRSMVSSEHALDQVATQTIKPMAEQGVPDMLKLEQGITDLLSADRDAYQALVAEFLALNNQDPSLRLKLSQANDSNLQQVVERVGQVAEVFDDEGNALYKEFKNQYALWQQKSRQAIVQNTSEQKAVEIRARMPERLVLFEAMRATIDEMQNHLAERIHQQEQQLVASSEDAVEDLKVVAVKTQKARVQFAILTLLIIATSLGLSLWTARLVSKRIGCIVAKIGELASNRDLTGTVDTSGKDELTALAKSFNDFVGTVGKIVVEAQQTSHEVAGAAAELSASSEQMATSMNSQTIQIKQIVASVEEMSSSIEDVAKKAVSASNNARNTGGAARSGGDVVKDTIDRMHTIEEAVEASAVAVRTLGQRGEEIGEVISVINEIAEQTNLLALNAAIEAARAGEHGRGFAVVADEVRKLADRTTKATEEIADSIKAIQTETQQAVGRMNTGTEQVRNGVLRASEAGESLDQIVCNTDEVTSMVEAIAAATEEQTATSVQINQSVESVSCSVNESSEAAAQSSEAIRVLSCRAEQLQQMIAMFRLK